MSLIDDVGTRRAILCIDLLSCVSDSSTHFGGYLIWTVYVAYSED